MQAFFNSLFYSQGFWLILLLVVMALSMVAQNRVQRCYQQYAQVPATSALPACRVAQQLLDQNGSSVRLTEVSGSLTDHYDPRNQTVGLSQQVYGSSSVAAMAVAAHEIGHVMQYQENYVPIRIRNAILPVARIGSMAAPYIVILGIVLGLIDLAWVGLILYAAMLLFQVATLPVEFNASSRALTMLRDGGYLGNQAELDGAKAVLHAAAMTYVWAAVASLVSFLRLFAMVNRNNRRR